MRSPENGTLSPLTRKRTMTGISNFMVADMGQILDKSEIRGILNLLDDVIDKGIEQEPLTFTLIAVGGTALTLKRIKISTKDLDFMVEGIDIERFKKFVSAVYKKNKCKI